MIFVFLTLIQNLSLWLADDTSTSASGLTPELIIEKQEQDLRAIKNLLLHNKLIINVKSNVL